MSLQAFSDCTGLTGFFPLYIDAFCQNFTLFFSKSFENKHHRWLSTWIIVSLDVLLHVKDRFLQKE